MYNKISFVCGGVINPKYSDRHNKKFGNTNLTYLKLPDAPFFKFQNT